MKYHEFPLEERPAPRSYGWERLARSSNVSIRVPLTKADLRRKAEDGVDLKHPSTAYVSACRFIRENAPDREIIVRREGDAERFWFVRRNIFNVGSTR